MTSYDPLPAPLPAHLEATEAKLHEFVGTVQAMTAAFRDAAITPSFSTISRDVDLLQSASKARQEALKFEQELAAAKFELVRTQQELSTVQRDLVNSQNTLTKTQQEQKKTQQQQTKTQEKLTHAQQELATARHDRDVAVKARADLAATTKRQELQLGHTSAVQRQLNEAENLRSDLKGEIIMLNEELVKARRGRADSEAEGRALATLLEEEKSKAIMYERKLHDAMEEVKRLKKGVVRGGGGGGQLSSSSDETGDLAEKIEKLTQVVEMLKKGGAEGGDANGANLRLMKNNILPRWGPRKVTIEDYDDDEL